jgi:hypothetical protein
MEMKARRQQSRNRQGALRRPNLEILPQRLIRGSPGRLALPAFLLLLSLTLPAWAQEDTPWARLFDTKAAMPEPLSSEALARQSGWELVPEDNVSHRFTGAAVLVNDKLLVVLRHGRGADVYAKTAGGPKFRATVGHAASVAADLEGLDGLQIVENTAGAVTVEARFKGRASPALRFRLTTGEALLELRPGAGAAMAAVQCPARQVVVPDYFGDDMVFGAATSAQCLPAENFCLHLIEGGEAILMAVWQSSEQDIWLDTPGSGAPGNLRSSRIRCLPDKRIWLAFLEAPGLWHAGNLPAADAWKPPFPAKWRCSLVRERNLADSWDLARGPLPEQTAGPHQGPLLIYPIDRTSATPLSASCPTDVMRNTLGVGPCQYILACEGLSAQGDPTPNSVMGWVEKQFEQKKARKAAEEIKERLGVMTEHVAQARGRIQTYARFSAQARQLVAGEPDAPAFLPRVEDLDRFVAAGLAPAASPELAGKLASEVSALVGQENALPACRRLGEQLRTLGALQDGTLARCRMAVRRLRQQAQTIAAQQPDAAARVKAVRELAEQFLMKK